VRFSIDTNVLFYSIDDRYPAKHKIALRIVDRGRYLDLILATQILGEFLNAVRRKMPDRMDQALGVVRLASTVFPIAPTRPEHLVAAAQLSHRHKLQFWDSVIVEVARTERVAVLLTEDMQDGATIDGVRIIDPFNPANDAIVKELLQ
jgi:predicted nucleic acid-binding protein